MEVRNIEVQPLWSSDDWAGKLPDSLQQQLSRPRQLPVLLACRNNSIIGWSSLIDRSNTLHEFYVKPKYRRRGVGTRLFRCQISLILDYGVSELSLQPEQMHSQAADGFLKRIHSGGRSTGTTLSLKTWMTASQRHIHAIQQSLGIPSTYGISRGLHLQQDANELTGIGLDCWQRAQKMLPRAAAAWTLMKHSAANDNITLIPVSAFRSIDYQSRLIERKLATGMDLESILKVSAAPGFSEHHSGRAIDITDGICEPLEDDFATSKAFQWLSFNAEDFGFYMSYPQDNPYGIIWEPWHWCWDAEGA